MVKIKIYIFLCALLPLSICSQENKLKGFDNLVDKTWVANGTWSNGSEFKQEVSFHYELNKTLVITNSKGFIDESQLEYGNRNHGVRQYNAEKDQVEFWEFDIFGGLTTGTVELTDNDILYHYKYGESIITDHWEYIDSNRYRFTVGTYKDGTWEAIYLQTEFKLKKE